MNEKCTTPKEDFITFLERKSKYKVGYIGVVMNLPNKKKPELIVNFCDEITEKIDYFKDKYNDELGLKTNPMVSILNYGWTVDFENLESLVEQYKNGGIN
jgi:hypothetical protein